VTDQFAAKIEDAHRVETLRQFLHQSLAPRDETSERLAQSVH
jgi:hypothetical protein